MKRKPLLILWTAIAVATIVTALMVLNHPTDPPATTRVSKAQEPARSEPVNLPVTPATTPMEPPPLVKTEAQSIVTTQAVVVTPPTVRDPRLDDPVFKEELGRYNLNFVGDDPNANEIWASLIYDTSLSESVREDLMENLNENGFSGGDGSVATVDDLPLIENRLALLKEHMSGADEFMLEHLAEAYKDLANMWIRLNGQ